MWFDPIRFSRFFPELELFDTPAARKRAWMAAWKFSYNTWMFIVFFFASGGVIGIATWTVIRFSGVVGSMISGSLPCLVVTYSWMWFGARYVRRSLRAQLNEQGIPVCIKCGYQLRGQVEARCPECGRAFDVSRLRGNADRVDEGESVK